MMPALLTRVSRAGEVRQHGLVQRRDGIGIADVARESANTGKRLRGCAEPVLIAAGPDHRVAAAEQMPGQLKADAPRASGDQDGSMFQLHTGLLW